MENITPAQQRVLDGLERLPGFRVDWDEDRGVAAVLRGADLGRLDDDDALGTLGTTGILFGPATGPGLAPALVPSGRDVRDDLGWRHLAYRQVVPSASGPLPLHRSVMTIHVRPDGDIVFVDSSCYRDVSLPAFDSFAVGVLRQRLLDAIEPARNFAELAAVNQGEPLFPMMTAPELIVHPRGAGFRPAYRVEAYALRDGVDPKAGDAEFGRVIVDAETGERFLFAPAARGQLAPAIGSGLSVTPLTGGFQRRELHITADPAAGTFLLDDRTTACPITTFTAATVKDVGMDYQRAAALHNGTMPVSSSATDRWDRGVSGRGAAARAGSQQPEVDLHFHMRAAFDWYARLARRTGWDDATMSEPFPVLGVAHVQDRWDRTASHLRRFVHERHLLMWIECPDQDGRTYTYSAGSRFIVGHEYHHGVNDFVFRDGPDTLGLDTAGDNWHSALDEGSADVFGGFVSGDWRPCRDISPVGRILRNLAFPRDTAAEDPANLDHFADRNVTAYRHARGTILAHAAYLMGTGGIHQRLSRTAVRIPVPGLGTEIHNGVKVRKAARVWYRALVDYLGHHGAVTGSGSQDEKLFPRLAAAVSDAAEDLYLPGSPELRTVRRALHAVGLYPASGVYGSDPGFLPPSAQWADSVPYVALPSSPWASRDLVVGPGDGTDEALIHCRVRNFGDAAATGLDVTFEYADLSIAGEQWEPALDSAGEPLVLRVGTLGEGQSSFPDEEQENPPATASLRWRRPPGSYSVRATVTGGGAVLDRVRSAAATLPFRPEGHTVTVYAGNPSGAVMEAHLDVETVLPAGWQVTVTGDTALKLDPYERRPIEIGIVPPAGVTGLDPPLDGAVTGRFGPPVDAEFHGVLAESTAKRRFLRRGWVVTGRLAAAVDRSTSVHGVFTGTVDNDTGRLSGTLAGSLDRAGEGRGTAVHLPVEGRVRPDRRVVLTQITADGVVGGLALHVDRPPEATSPRSRRNRR